MAGTDSAARLTGGQVQQILDYFIYEALRPIILYSDVFDTQLSHMVAFVATNRKRKLSAHDRDVFMSLACGALCEQDKDKKFELITQLKLERSFVFLFIEKFLSLCSRYAEHYRQHLTTTGITKISHERKMRAIETTVGIEEKRLFSALTYTEDFLAQAYAFRNKIVLQYVNYAWKFTNSHCKDHPNYDEEDLNQNLMAAISRALDKFDSSKGALTSYVAFWIQHALTYRNSKHGYEYGIAFAVSSQMKKSQASGSSTINNFSISLDTPSTTDEPSHVDLLDGDGAIDYDLEKHEEQLRLRLLAKAADPTGIARLYLDIEEVFNDDELDTMRQHMLQQNAETVKTQ